MTAVAVKLWSFKMPQSYQDVANLTTPDSAQRWAAVFRRWSRDPDVLEFYYITTLQAVAAAGYWQSIAEAHHKLAVTS